MLEIGQMFKKNGYTYCVLDFVNFDNKKYVLFSLESEKLSYLFYEIHEDETGYNLLKVNDDNLNFKLLEIIENKED